MDADKKTKTMEVVNIIESAKNTQIMKLKYKEAEIIIHKQCKNFIKTQEFQKLSSLLLAQQHNYISRQVNAEKRTIDECKFKEEKLNTELSRSNEEMKHLQQSVENAGEIMQKLQGLTTTLKLKAKNLENARLELLAKVQNQIERFENSEKSKIAELSSLRKSLDDKKAVISEEIDAETKNNSLLKQQIEEKRNYIQKLKERAKEMETNVQKIKNFEEEKNLLETQLEQKKEKFKEMKDKFDHLYVEKNCRITRLNLELESKIQNIDIVKNKLAETDEKIKECNETKQQLNELLDTQKESLCAIQDKSKKLNEGLIEIEMRSVELSAEHTKKLDMKKAELSTAKTNMISLSDELMNKMKTSELLFKTYSSKIEQKNELMKKKAVLQEKLNSEKLLIIKNQLLEEKQEKIECKIEKIKEDLDNLTADKDVMALSKTKNYLIACRDYLSEKSENLQKQKDDAEGILKQYSDEIIDINKKINEIKPIKGTKSGSKLGILKRKDRPTNKPTKKVKFEKIQDGASSETDIDAVFDQMMANFRKANEATTTQQNFRRKLDLD